MDEDDLNESSEQDGNDAAGYDEQQAPFAPNKDPLNVEQPGEDIDPGEEATRIGQELDNLEIDGDETPAPDMPESEASPADPGEASLPVIPEIADEGRAPFGADTANVDLAEELPGADTASEFTPDFEELDNTQSAMEQFGNDVDRFTAAGGADASVPNVDDSEGDKDGADQLINSDFENRNQIKEMLIEHARRLDEITRFLEAERL